MKPGNIIFIYLVDGSQIIATYLREERGFLLFEEEGNVIALRPSSISTVTDTEKRPEDLVPLGLKKDLIPEEDIPTEIIPVGSGPLSYPSRGRLHL